MEVFEDLRWVLSGFNRLSNARPIGLAGPLRIPLTEIEAFCRIKRFDYAKTQDFLFYVERLDEAYMAFVKKLQDEEERKNSKNGAPAPPGRGGRR